MSIRYSRESGPRFVGFVEFIGLVGFIGFSRLCVSWLVNVSTGPDVHHIDHSRILVNPVNNTQVPCSVAPQPCEAATKMLNMWMPPICRRLL